MSRRYLLAADLVRSYVASSSGLDALDEIMAAAQRQELELWLSGLAPILAIESLGSSASVSSQSRARLASLLADCALLPVSGNALASVLRDASPAAVANAEANLARHLSSLTVLTLDPESWQETGLPTATPEAVLEEVGSARIPLVDLAAQLAGIADEIHEAVWRVLTSSGFILGQQVRAFEEEFAAYCGAGHAVALNSGTDALHLGLRALGVGPGDGVVTVAFTFAATAETVVMTGATPLFVEVDSRDFNMSPAALEDFLKSRAVPDGRGFKDRVTGVRLKAILPVHLYGQMADMKPLLELAHEYGLAVLEDAAQAHGATLWTGDGWALAGSLGDGAAFSFYPAKNLGAYGDAGAFVTSDAELAQQVALLRDHGRHSKYEHMIPAWSSRMDALQAAILRVKLRHLDDWIEARRKAACRYDQLLQHVAGLELPAERADARHVYHLYVVRMASNVREQVQDALRAQGIETGIHYPIALHQQLAFQKFVGNDTVLPLSSKLADEILSLPIYPEITESDQQKVAHALAAALSR